MAKTILDNKMLLNLIEKKKLNAQQICDKTGFNIGTLRRRHHVLMLNERRYVDLPGLFDPDNVAELKKGGVTISAKKLAALDCPHDIGTKFTVVINQKTKKIVLTAQG